jgi:hypothetical protein
VEPTAPLHFHEFSTRATDSRTPRSGGAFSRAEGCSVSKTMGSVWWEIVIASVLTCVPALAETPKGAPRGADGAKAAGAASKWRVSVTTSMPGSPVAPPPSSFEFCQTESKRVPFDPKDPQQSGCSVLTQKAEGATVSWTMRCDRGVSMTGEGRITYEGDTFRGQTKMKGDAGGQPFEVTQQLSGQRMGSCSP